MDGIDLSCFKCELGLKHMIFGVYVQEFVGFGAARREKRLMKKMVNKGKNKKNNASTRDALYDVMYEKHKHKNRITPD